VVLEIYLATCAVIAWIGRRRILGFWGNFILAFFVSPLVVAIIIFAGSVRPKAPSPPVKPVAG
jgi:hypothetical protein